MYLDTRGLLTSHYVCLMDTENVAAQTLFHSGNKKLVSEAWIRNGQWEKCRAYI